jgi:hypothetical protein
MALNRASSAAVVVGCLVVVGIPSTASAQPLGTFGWQLQPYCNVVRVTVVQQGAQYLLDGTDDQCGASQKASVTGLAFLNADGTVGFGLNVVTAPGGVPVHVNATISIATLSGTWRDSAGATGPMVFTPGAGSGGNARPIPAIGNGDISAVIAGDGLIGGAPSGAATLAVAFAGAGSARTVARSDHDHASGSGTSNTELGSSALFPDTTGEALTGIGAAALSNNTTGSFNTATGTFALQSNTTGSFNTAVGSGAMRESQTASRNVAVGDNALNVNLIGIDNTALGYRALMNSTGSSNTAAGSEALGANSAGTNNTAVGAGALKATTNGVQNTAIGGAALTSNTTGFDNTAAGHNALLANTTGNYNVAIGQGALMNNVSSSNSVAIGRDALKNSPGSGNIAVGTFAGNNLTSGNNNIIIGMFGPSSDSNSTYIAHISGTTSSGGTGVFINAAGKLGTATSSIRFKEDVRSLKDAGALMSLRPVSFYYRPEFDDGSKVRQFGLIAEEVADVMPELVVRDALGAAQTVRYHFLPPLLLAEVQRLERERTDLTRKVAAQAAALADQAAAIDELRAALADLRARMR